MPNHLIDINSLGLPTILSILEKAKHYQAQLVSGHTPPDTTTHNGLMVNLFYEPSTRTQYSFDIAASRLGLKVINPNMATLSDKKGEGIIDTLVTFQQMGVNLITLRHPTDKLHHELINEISTPLINAGDGCNQHPSQAFIDIFSILQHKSHIQDLSIAIVGDSIHSRVAHSLIDILTVLDAKEIRLIGPKSLISNHPASIISRHESLIEGLDNADVVITLRINKERFEHNQDIPNTMEYHTKYGLTQQALTHANPNAIILHPGPVNRGIEIESALISCPQSIIHQQVSNGIPIRMALINHCLSIN